MQFYEQLQKSADSVPEKNYLYICGDFNARVGRSTKQENEWHASLGNFGTGIRNENGLLLLEFCANNYLRICNTFLNTKFEVPPSQNQKTTLNCYVDTTLECWRDHQMVVLRQRIKNQMNKKIKQI